MRDSSSIFLGAAALTSTSINILFEQVYKIACGDCMAEFIDQKAAGKSPNYSHESADKVRPRRTSRDYTICFRNLLDPGSIFINFESLVLFVEI